MKTTSDQNLDDDLRAEYDFHSLFVARGRERLAAWDQVKRLVEQPVGRIGGVLPPRAELHDR